MGMPFLKLFPTFQLKISLVFFLILFYIYSFSQNESTSPISHNLIEDSKKETSFPSTKNDENTYLIQKNDILQTLNRSYVQKPFVQLLSLLWFSFSKS